MGKTPIGEYLTIVRFVGTIKHTINLLIHVLRGFKVFWGEGVVQSIDCPVL